MTVAVAPPPSPASPMPIDPVIGLDLDEQRAARAPAPRRRWHKADRSGRTARSCGYRRSSWSAFLSSHRQGSRPPEIGPGMHRLANHYPLQARWRGTRIGASFGPWWSRGGSNPSALETVCNMESAGDTPAAGWRSERQPFHAALLPSLAGGRPLPGDAPLCSAMGVRSIARGACPTSLCSSLSSVPFGLRSARRRT